MKKIIITAVSISVVLSVLILLIASGTFRPRCSLDFAQRVSFTSTVYSEDGTRIVEIYDLTQDSLEILKGVFNGKKIYKTCDDNIGFENYVLTFTDGVKSVRLRVADDGSSYIKHDKGYFALKDDEKEKLFNIIYQYM